ARTLQPSRRSSALQPTHPHRSMTSQGDAELELQRRLDVPSRTNRRRDDSIERAAARRMSESSLLHFQPIHFLPRLSQTKALTVSNAPPRAG
ncbi:hypothetical protein LN451_03015, partial [Xanthomonas hortorum pv. gardneri]